MKKALITGAAGFVGYYLIEHLYQEYGWKLWATHLPHETLKTEHAHTLPLDILDVGQTLKTLQDIKPDYIFHLAAQSSVSRSWQQPGETIDVNVKGTITLLDAVRESQSNPRILLIGSGEEYGRIKESDTPISEETLLRPGNIYAASKAAQTLVGKIYADAYDLDIILVRAFNHIGPRQTPTFVVADFCQQVAEIEKGRREPVIKVGNLSARRDFTDVRDIVKAYGLLIQKGSKGEIYNVGSGMAMPVEHILHTIISLSTVPVQVEVDRQKLRPVDVPIIEAAIGKLQKCTGWQPQIVLEQSLEDTLNYWRENV